MCGRIVQASGPLRLAIGDGLDVREDRTSNVPRRYNGAPSQQLLLIRKNHRTGDRSLDLLAWGLIPNWCQDLKWWTQTDQRQSRDHCRDAYRLRRCIVPVDGFFEWQAMTGGKQPYAIAMKGRIMGELEKRYHPRMGSGLHDPVPSNDLVSRIHDRMPAIVDRRHYDRWLGREADPHDLLVTYSSEPMRMWPISKRVNKPENDDAAILEPVDLDDAA
jgi:putative SOS response-associated peptidase YedK